MRLVHAPSTERHFVIDNARVHLNNIKYVIALLTDAGFDVQISDREYVYDDLDELIRERGVHPKELWLSGIQPEPSVDEIKVLFRSGQITIQDFTNGRYERFTQQIREYLTHTRSRVAASFPFVPSVGILAVALFLYASGWTYTQGGVDRSAWFGASLVGVALVALIFHVSYLGIWLRPQHESAFLRRHADKIGPGLIVAVVSAILGAFLKPLAERLLAR